SLCGKQPWISGDLQILYITLAPASLCHVFRRGATWRTCFFLSLRSTPLGSSSPYYVVVPCRTPLRRPRASRLISFLFVATLHTARLPNGINLTLLTGQAARRANRARCSILANPWCAYSRP